MIKLKSILLEETKNNTTRLAMFSEAEADDDPFNNRDYPPKLKGLGAVKKGEFSVSSAADPAPGPATECSRARGGCTGEPDSRTPRWRSPLRRSARHTSRRPDRPPARRRQDRA